jgi:hypothetical protein
MRGRNRPKGPNPLTRSYESNGPDVKIRGTAQHVADKYAQLARDAQASGDPVAAENYFQHAEHYYRIIATAQEALRQQYGYGQRPFDEDGEEGDEESFGYGQQGGGAPQPGDEDFGSQPQPFEPRGEQQQQPRFDRPYGQDRGDRQDRGERQDRGDRQDRPGGGDRPDQRFNRNDNRGDNRGDRQNRGERFDRGPERQDRGGGDRQDRGDRFQQPRPPRQDFQNGAPRPDRQDRQDRGDFRRDRPPREEPEAEVNGGLPAFLTTPVRAPIAIAEGESRDVAPAVPGAPEEAAFRAPRRRRRRPFEAGEGSEPAADFVPEGAETPPAE